MLSLTASALEYPLPFLNNNANPTPCEYIRALYIWGLGIVGAVAVTSIAIGGFLYMTNQVQKGKDYILSALLGLLLLLGSWLLLNTINPDLAKLKCDLPASTASLSTSATPTPTLTPTPTPPTGSSDGAVRARLAGFGFNRNCINENATTCQVNGQDQTCLNGLKTSTISGATTLKTNCQCSPTITGGTEKCHSSTGLNNHINGSKLDFAASSPNQTNNTLDNYLTQNSCTKVKDATCKINNTTYRYELNQKGNGYHWDACFGC